MTNQQSAELSQPGVGALDDPASSVPSEFPSVLMLSLLVVFAVRDDEVNATLLESLAQWIGVVRAVGDHTLRFRSRSTFGAWDLDFGERGFRKRNFCRRGTFKPNSQRKTPTVDQYHPLRPLAALGFTDGGAPFFAGAKLPSRNASSHFSNPCASSAPSNARHASSQTSCSSHCLKRRQQVAGEGYLSGKNLHAAPSGVPTECPPDRPGWTPRDGPACPCDASVRAAAALSASTAHHSTARIDSCSCKKFNKPHTPRRSPQLEAEPIYETRSTDLIGDLSSPDSAQTS
jgi:hypothetical protein